MITKLRRRLSDQLSRPSGRAGRVVATLMNRGNRGLNQQAITLLDVHPGTRVLDLGFGGGLTFPALLDAGASVVGVDRAPDMVEAAAARHRADDRVNVHVGDVNALPLADAAVDRVLTVNTVYFWPHLDAALREVHRVLAPDGRLVIGIRDGSVMQQVSPDVFTLRTPDELVDGLRAAGFEDVALRSADDRTTHLVTGVATPRRPAG